MAARERFGLIFASVISALFVGLAAYVFNHWSGSMFQVANVDETWVALAALMGAIRAPTIFAPMIGVFFQTMSQVGMAAAGTAVAIGAGGLGPASAGVAGGIPAAGQALAGLASSNPSAGFVQKAGAALGGFGGAFGKAVPHVAQNMALMGTVGTLGGLGASRSASAINRAIDLKMPAQTKQNIFAYRAGMLTNELKLPPEEMKGIMSRALGVEVCHEKDRRVRRALSQRSSQAEGCDRNRAQDWESVNRPDRRGNKRRLMSLACKNRRSLAPRVLPF